MDACDIAGSGLLALALSLSFVDSAETTQCKGEPKMKVYDSLGPNPLALRMFLLEKGIPLPAPPE